MAMKARSIIITALALLTIAPTASAQKKIKEAFADVVKYDGVTVTGEQKLASTIDPNRMTAESSIVNIKVQGKNACRAVFDKLKKAFADEGKNGKTVVIEEGFEGVEMDSASVLDLGLRGTPMRIWREGAEPVVVGIMKHNSCYRLMEFEDKEYPGYRTCYAAEWIKDTHSDVYTAKLVYVYGLKPNNGQLPQYKGLEKILNGVYLPDDLEQRIKEYHSKYDTLFIKPQPKNIFDLAKNSANNFGTAPQDIPVDGDLPTWMNKAMNNVKHLSNSDWHRMFGLLTQQMMNEGEGKKSMEDLIITAGIILDLCKNADQLDADERRISSTRLTEVARFFHGDKYQYIHDLLTLGARKLEKK